jgi:hypothetical protein
MSFAANVMSSAFPFKTFPRLTGTSILEPSFWVLKILAPPLLAVVAKASRHRNCLNNRHSGPIIENKPARQLDRSGHVNHVGIAHGDSVERSYFDIEARIPRVKQPIEINFNLVRPAHVHSLDDLEILESALACDHDRAPGAGMLANATGHRKHFNEAALALEVIEVRLFDCADHGNRSCFEFFDKNRDLRILEVVLTPFIGGVSCRNWSVVRPVAGTRPIKGRATCPSAATRTVSFSSGTLKTSTSSTSSGPSI